MNDASIYGVKDMTNTLGGVYDRVLARYHERVHNVYYLFHTLVHQDDEGFGPSLYRHERVGNGLCHCIP